MDALIYVCKEAPARALQDLHREANTLYRMNGSSNAMPKLRWQERRLSFR